MATTVQIINELYDEVVKQVSQDSHSWQDFLKTASMNYTNSFSEQLLIYAQRPETVASADIDTWNKTYKRLVNKGCKGIGLLTEVNGYPRIRYVWGLNDTHSIYDNGKQLKIWQVPKVYEEQIIEKLENSFGEISNKDNFVDAIKDIANNLVEDNYLDYFDDLIDNKIGTSLEYIDDNVIRNKFKILLKNSVAYMMLNRSGINPMPYFTYTDFVDIVMFQNLDTLARFGSATSDISKIGLREIYKSLKNVQKEEINKIRTFARNNNLGYDEVEKEKSYERSDIYEHNLQESERLSNTQSSSDGKRGESDRQVRNDEVRILEKQETGNLSSNGYERNFNESLTRDRKDISKENRFDNKQDEERVTDNRRIEEERSDEVVRNDEQHQESSRGDSNERTNLQLEYWNKDSGVHCPYVVTDDKINQILATITVKVSNSKLKDFFANEEDIKVRANYLKSIFGNIDDITHIGGDTYGYKAFDNGLLLWKDDFLLRDTESFISWEDLTYHYDSMILLHQLKGLAQLSLLDEDKELPELEFSQEFIDRYLQTRNSENKFSIYKQFQKNLSDAENANFIKNLYGIGGSTSVIRGSGIGYNADSNGLTLYRGYFKDEIKIQLKWNYVAKRIKELIKLDKYLNQDELKEIQKISKTSEKELLLGTEFEWNNRKYRIDEISGDEVDLRDITFQSTSNLPIFRVEKLDKIKLLLAEKEETPEEDVEIIDNPDLVIPVKEKKVRNKVTNYILHPEVPYEERLNYKITEDYLGVGNPKERYKNNINAIKVLKLCEKEDRYATSEEQEILSKYVGWGGLSKAFDKNSDWKDEYKELKEILTEKEYKSARDTVLNAFYTPPIVIKSMYEALEKMGLNKGNILEPSCGIGNFIGMLPNNDNLKIYGVELDSISGRIARQLYQKSSIAITGFEKVNYSDSFFDVAIGNVPFGTERLSDKKYDRYNFLIHDYFFAKTIDKVRPGGIIAFITSKGTMDKKDDNVRKYIASRADLLGAIRLPNNVFENSAGTTITSDIIFLQKRNSITNVMPDWVNLDINDDGIEMNKYFVDNPKMVLGNMKMVPNQYGGYSSTCKPYNDKKLDVLLNNAISNINAEIKDYEIDEIEEDSSIEADIDVRNFSYTLVDDVIYFRENSRMYPQKLSVTAEKRVRDLIELRDLTRKIIDMQLQDYSDEDIKIEQDKLNTIYDNFTKKYGLINSRGNSTAFSNDSSYFLLCSLEILDENGNLQRKADMFTKRTVRPYNKTRVVENARDALIVSINDKARVDLNYIQSLCNLNMDKIIKDLEGEIFRVPEYGNHNNWVTADEYLSGNVREKLKIAKEFAEDDDSYKINVMYLEKTMPKDIPTEEISVRLGATWIPEDVIEKFMFELLDSSYYARSNMKIHYSNLTGEWNIENKRYDRNSVSVTSTYGTSRANAYRLIEDALNLRDTKIFDYRIDEEGKKKAILNKRDTAIAQAKQDKIKQSFQDWIWKDYDRRERLTMLYNEKFNSFKTREYDGSHIEFEGMNPEIKLRSHQVNAIARILYGGNTLLAHEVGAGKTFEMVAAAMESKRLGLCNKSLFVVPNHIIEQFASEFLQLYPSANILVSSKKDFEASRRKKFCSRIATGDYDAIIIGHSQFEKIPISIERQIYILEQQLDDITLGIEDLKKNNGENFSIKMLIKSQKSIQRKLDKLYDRDKKDDVVTFEELGTDRLFVDEAHYYKNLYLYTKMRNVGGIAGTEAQKSSDLFMKCRYLDELTGNKGVIFATGTPISNSMTELYTMQRYLQYDDLLNSNLQHFDAWASTFGETVSAIELSPEGTGYRSKTRFSKFYNLPELMTMFREVADIQTADMLKLPVPKEHFENVVVKPSDTQLELVESFGKRAEKVRNKEVDPSDDNMLKITNDGRKVALDQRLINELLPDYEGSKVCACVNNVYKIWEETKVDRLSQLIFCDASTPKADGSFNVYDDIKKKLIEKGIPEDEIEFIHNANTEVQKQELFAKVRVGKVRILIGSTQKMGAGTNCQDKLIALHDLDCPWRPSDLTQRKGRIVRQGNQNSDVYIYRYVTEKTFDAYLYQLVENKQKFISQIMTSKTPVRSAEDIDEVALSYAEIKALAAGNPLIIEKTELDNKVSKLQLLKQDYLSEQYKLEEKVRKTYPNEIKRLETQLENYKKDVEELNKTTPYSEDNFLGMTIDGKFYDTRKDAGEQILNECKKYADDEKHCIGEYCCFKLELQFVPFLKSYRLYLENNATYSVELGSSDVGNIVKIDNVIKGISEKIVYTEEDILDNKTQLDKAKGQLGIPFNQEEELKSKMKRLNEVNKLLSMDEKTHDIIDEEEEVINTKEERKNDYER